MSDPTVSTFDLFNLGSRGLQHHGLRRANERAVLTVIGFNPGLSNAEIARMSGLAPQTVSAILNDIEALGLIRRGEVLRGRRGQPATPIYLRAEGSFGIGVELGWRHVDIVAINMHANMLAQRHFAYGAEDVAGLPSRISETIAEIVRDWPDAHRARLTDIGIAMPSTIDGNMESPDQGGGAPWRKQFVAKIEELTGLPVMIFNDGNAACWAELVARPAPRPESFIYLLVSTYLGAGLVGEGRLWHGPAGQSADLGMMLVGQDGNGPRSANSYASIRSLAERASAAGFDVGLGTLEAWDWSALEAVLQDWLKDCAKALAMVIYNTNAVVESGLAVLDTILPQEITEQLVRMVASEFDRLPKRHRVDFVMGVTGQLAPALGAAELPLYQRYFSRNLFEKSPLNAETAARRKKPYKGEERRMARRDGTA